MKKIVSLALMLGLLLCAFALFSCDSVSSGSGEQSKTQTEKEFSDSDSNGSTEKSQTEKEEEFYNLVDETKDLLDIVADDIYSYWYDCIYRDKYLKDVSYAVACATNDNAGNINTIEENTIRIKGLYKEIKNGKLGSEAKAVMQAYNDYYTFVVEVSGSFNSYSASKETYKKELASTLDDFSLELD